jgi:hypothetical protein
MSEPFLRQDKLKLRPPNSQERSPCSLARLKPGRYIERRSFSNSISVRTGTPWLKPVVGWALFRGA